MNAMPLRVLAARSQQVLGWAGLVGVAAMLVSATWLGLAWYARGVPLPEVGLAAPPSTPVVQTQNPSAPTALELPRRSEMPLLLTQIQQTVVSQSLTWAAADYKLVPASDAVPASMEVRCALKGTYPKLRAALALLLRRVPGLSIRDLALSRPNSDVAEVEAKLTLAVFLQDDASAIVSDSARARP